jgi:hypothetical protein
VQNVSPEGQRFDFWSLQFEFAALEAFVFPPVLSANIFRGAFGLMLRRISPDAYNTIFAPVASAQGPSGLVNQPRPFVFRARHLDGRSVSPGESFHITINIFQADEQRVAYLTNTFRETFEEIARAGFGPQRSRARFSSAASPPQLLSLPLSRGASAQRLRVDFLTPTELKSDSHILDVPGFGALLCRARDRISTLRALYGAGPLEIDFEALSARAATVHLVRDKIHHIEASRRSSRSGQTHPLGGFVGFAEYDGALSEFLPYLEIAAHTGVGRQTVWGKGEIATRILA